MEGRILGLEITSVEVLTPSIIKLPSAGPQEFSQHLVTARFVNTFRRGKHLIFGLDNGYALYAHLNMRGQIVVSANFDEPRGKYLCAAIRFVDNSELRYHDIWRWGELRVLLNTPEEICKYVPALSAMGPEPLSEAFDGSLLRQGARSKSGSPIKVALLDQAVVAGVGNIYADEALFRSGVSPIRKTGSLTDKEWSELAKQIKAVLDEAVEAGGTLSDNYVNIDGAAGRYRPQVYGRAKETCLRCQTPLTGARLGGRSTVFCPKCQN